LNPLPGPGWIPRPSFYLLKSPSNFFFFTLWLPLVGFFRFVCDFAISAIPFLTSLFLSQLFLRLFGSWNRLHQSLDPLHFEEGT